MANDNQNQIPGGPAINPENKRLDSADPAENPEEEILEPSSNQLSDIDYRSRRSSRQRIARKAYDVAKDNLKEKGKEVVKEKFKKEALKALGKVAAQAGKAAASWLAALLGPYGMIAVVAIALLLFALVPSFGAIGSADGGVYGRKKAESISAFDVKNIVLGNVPYRDWYRNQYIGDWSGDRYPSPSKPNATVATSGCGCTSASMVLERYGVDTDPRIICAWSLANGGRVDGGTAYSFFPNVAKEFGFKHKKINEETALRVLAEGMPVILCVSGARNAQKVRTAPFTGGRGHFIVLAGRQGDTIFVNNSAISSNTTTDIAEVRRWFKNGYYLIYPEALSQYVEN